MYPDNNPVHNPQSSSVDNAAHSEKPIISTVDLIPPTQAMIPRTLVPGILRHHRHVTIESLRQEPHSLDVVVWRGTTDGEETLTCYSQPKLSQGKDAPHRMLSNLFVALGNLLTRFNFSVFHAPSPWQWVLRGRGNGLRWQMVRVTNFEGDGTRPFGIWRWDTLNSILISKVFSTERSLGCSTSWRRLITTQVSPIPLEWTME